MSPIMSAAIKAGGAGAAIAVILYRTRDVKREQMGIARPLIIPAFSFYAIFIGWMLLSNALIGWRGPWDFAPWRAAPLEASALRVLAVVILGPIAEELAFRGFLFWYLRRFGVPVAIGVTSVGWAALHFSYNWQVIGVIIVDGLLLGLARWRCRSVWGCVVMHMTYNLYAIW